MLESELDTCCIYPGPTGRIPNPARYTIEEVVLVNFSASRLFVAETCYLLWQCMAAVGPRAMISHRVPLQAIASRLVLGELDPELRGLATFGKYFISFQYADDSMAMQEQEEAARAERERERSEGYSSPPR